MMTFLLHYAGIKPWGKKKSDWGKCLGLPHTGYGPEHNVARLLFHRVKCTVSRETNGTDRES